MYLVPEYILKSPESKGIVQAQAGMELYLEANGYTYEAARRLGFTLQHFATLGRFVRVCRPAPENEKLQPCHLPLQPDLPMILEEQCSAFLRTRQFPDASEEERLRQLLYEALVNRRQTIYVGNHPTWHKFTVSSRYPLPTTPEHIRGVLNYLDYRQRYNVGRADPMLEDLFRRVLEAQQ